MDHFDQLIKNIANSKEQPFKEVHWSSFAKKAGIKKTLSTGKIVLLSAGTGIMLACGGWLAYTLSHSKNSPEPPIFTNIIKEENRIHEEDSVVLFEDIVEETILPNKMTMVANTAKDPEEPSETSPMIPEEPNKSEKKEEKYRLRKVFINTDTITDIYH